MELQDILKKYKEATILLLKELNNDGDAELYINQREELLESIKSNAFNKIEFINIYNELGIEALESEVSKEMMELRDSIKNDMIELKKQKDAVKGYTTNFKNINFLNQHI